MSLRLAILVPAFLVGLLQSPAYAEIDEEELRQLVGYTVVEVTAVRGSYHGVSFGDVIVLENGWMFESMDWTYTYDYNPTVVVFARTFSVYELRQAGFQASEPITLYKLVIDGEVLQFLRIK